MLDDFRGQARSWLAGNKAHAPRSYGAIVPADLVDDAKAWQRRLFDGGFAGLHWPERVGGRGLTPDHTAVWMEEAALADVPAVLNMVGLVLMGGTVLAWGTPEQQDEHLPPALRGEEVWCQLFSEPGAGSDLASLSTAAVRDGDTWVVTGQKVWCSNGRVADKGILLARTDFEAPKHEGISFFLLDMAAPGVDIRPLRQLTGDSEFDEVFLDEVRIPADRLVGPLHGGWRVAMSTLTNERGHIGASAIALGRRLAGGAPPELLVRGHALQTLARRQGAEATTAASLLKLGISELLFDLAVADAAGPDAMLDGELARSLLAAPGARIAGGTSQVQRNIIGELLLGLPREPRG